METSSSGRLCCYPNSRKSHGTHRHASVYRTDTQTSKVWTIQMMMTLILTLALRVKTNTEQGSHVILSIQFDTNVSQLLRRVMTWSCDPLPSLGELSSSRLTRLSVCLSCLFWLCIPPVVYGRTILCLLCLRVDLFSEVKKRGFHFF